VVVGNSHTAGKGGWRMHRFHAALIDRQSPQAFAPLPPSSLLTLGTKVFLPWLLLLAKCVNQCASVLPARPTD
jgi:hypothetical protein